MRHIRRILVAIKDPRAGRNPALAKAAQLARGLHAELCLFHALTDPVYLDVEPLNDPSLEELERQSMRAHCARLAKLASRVRPRTVNVTTAAEWDYPAHEAVIRAAERLHADLIVAECRRTHLAPWLLQFTDWELLRHSPLPVLLVKGHGLYHRPSVLAAVDPVHVKPARVDEEILQYGATVSGALRGALHAVHAYSPQLINMAAGEFATARGLAEADAEAAAAAHAAVDPRLKSAGIARTRRHVLNGFAVDVIEDVARKIHAQILVMGAVSRSGLRRLLIGNTAERMLDRVSCDVLVVKPRRFPVRMARRPRGPRFVATRVFPAVMH